MSPSDATLRLDLFLADKLKITRSAAKKLIDSGEVQVNGDIQKSNYQPRENDSIKYTKTETTKKNVQVPIIFEDDSILVINKPAGISVHPAAGEKDQTLTELFAEKLGFEEGERPGVVHRLDKGTSGVMVFAKSAEAKDFLVNEFKKRNVKKIYNALVWGKIVPPSGIINMPLERELVDRKKIGISTTGKEAITEYKTIETYRGYSLVEATPRTGRTHQIRVHFSSLGYPIVGDIRYGRKDPESKRMFLHAKSLSFRHPQTKKIVTYVSELPAELTKVLSSLD